MKIEEKLKESAGKLLDFVEKSGDFIVEQAPLYVQELIEYHFFENLLGLVLCSVLFFISVSIWVVILVFITKSKYNDKIYECTITSVLSITILIPITMGVVCFGKECYKAKNTPRVFIVEKLNKLR